MCLHAQDVAEAARQEKARKAAQGKPKSKIYTDEDLKKPQILSQEDRARAQAAKKEKEPGVPPTVPPTQSVDAGSGQQPESLGEIARRYRREKEAREAEQAKKEPPPSPYKMDLPQTALAAPVAPRVAPIAPLVVRPVPEKPVARTSPGRRNPFSRAAPSAASHGSITPVAPATTAPGKSGPVVRSFAPKTEVMALPSVRTTVKIPSGSSLWKLSRQYLGSGSRWHELAAVNPGLPDPTRIRAGSAVVIPRAAARVSASPSASFKVRKGDSLWKIAEAQFGSGSQWRCLARANPQLSDFDLIRPGQSIAIPAMCGATP